jgi:hypothetical protein
MPKLSFAQTVVELREIVAAVRSLTGVLPKLALAVADGLEAQVAAIQELKSRQRIYVAELKIVAEAKQAAIARGRVAARDIRACAVLVYGPRSARLAQFQIRILRRPNHRMEDAPRFPSIPSVNMRNRAGDRCAEIVKAPSETWMTQTARANDSAAGTEVQPVGENVDPVGGNAPALGGNTGIARANAAPVGTIAAAGGGWDGADRGNASALRANPQAAGGNLAASPDA